MPLAKKRWVHFPLTSVASTVTGGSGTTNTLTLAEMTDLTPMNWTIGSNFGGNVGNISFTEVQNLAGAAEADNIFTFSGDFEITNITGGINSLINRIEGPPAGVIQWHVTGANDSGTINTGSHTASFSYINSLKGRSPFPSDILTGPDSATDWFIDGVNEGTFSTPALGISHLAFTGMEQLAGGTANDIFTFAAPGQVTGVGVGLIGIDGSAGGVNTIQGPAGSGLVSWILASPLTGSIDPGAGSTNFSGVQVLAGQSTNDRLTGPNAVTTWNITGSDSGNVNTTDILFSGIESLVGGSGNNTFVFSNGASIQESIDGGIGGGNAFHYQLYTTPVYVDLSSGAATGAPAFSHIESFIGGSGSNTLAGDNIANTWNITSDNAGDLNGSVFFADFQTLIGGTDVDNFIFADQIGLNGSLYGGGAAASNTMDYTAYTIPAVIHLTTSTSGLASNLGASFYDVANFVENVNVIEPPPPAPSSPISHSTKLFYSTESGVVLKGVDQYFFFYNPKSLRYCFLHSILTLDLNF